MKLLIAIGLAILGSASGAVIKSSQCDDRLFVKCATEYAGKLGFTDMPSDANMFALAIKEMILNQSLAGMQYTCSAFESFKSCLGDQYSSCVSIDYLISAGESASDATVYLTLAAQEDYFCTDAWSTIVDNWDCIYKTYTTQQVYMDQCKLDYVKHVNADPTRICEYNQVMTDCFAHAYDVGCGSKDVDAVFCHSMQIAFSASFPQCGEVTC